MKSEEEKDALISSANHSVKLSMFEGPLDLLLFLIRKNEVDIYDIPIEKVTQQYLEYLFALEKLDLELTGEFFVMAATLMVIKSRMLIPKNERPQEEEPETEEEDPRWELVQQLLDYKKIKEQASQLEKMMELRQGLIPRDVKDDIKDQSTRPLKQTDKIQLWNSFNKVLQRLAEKIVSGEINDDTITVAEQMNLVLKTLETKPKFYFSSLLPEKSSINMLVSTFLAVLELTRMNTLHLEQTENFGDILCSKRHNEDLAV